MSLIAIQTLADYLGVPVTESGLQAYLDRAEAYTATTIGASDLAQRTGVEETVTVDLRDGFSGLATRPVASNVFYFSDGPVTSVTSVTLNGSDVKADSTLDSRGWTLTFPAVLKNSFSFDPAFYDPAAFSDRFLATLKVVYTAGWATEADLPSSVKQYVLMTAAKYYSVPVDGLYMVRVGDNYVTLDKTMFEAEYKRNERLLDRYKRGYL